MKKTAIDFDLSGYSYDPAYPTRESEKLCFKLNAILDQLKTDGFELRMVEPQDATDTETYINDLFDLIKTPPEQVPSVETPTNADILLDESLYSSIMSARKAWLLEVLKRVGVEGNQSTDEIIAEALVGLEEVNRLALTKEEILYLSDGTPIFVRAGLIGG